MKDPPQTPKYPHKPIRSLRALEKALQTPLRKIVRIAQNADALYRKAKPIIKQDGSIRQPYDAQPALKRIQKRIRTQFLDRVHFPPYLTGSIKGRDARKNAAIHAGAKIVICEDIQKFFPSTTAQRVFSVWCDFFGFSPDVAKLLTALTTKAGILPEGANTSSHLANLVFHNTEPLVHAKLAELGIAYSRYVDDISISSNSEIPPEIITRAIGWIYGMMFKYGYRPKRSKHEIHRRHHPMLVTKHVINVKPGLPHSERQAIRAAIHQLEQVKGTEVCSHAHSKALNSTAGRVNRLAQYHPTEGKRLQEQIKALRLVIRRDCRAIQT